MTSNKKSASRFEYASLGKVKTEAGGASDWLYYKQSRGFPENLLGFFRNTALQQPDIMHGFQSCRSASVAVLRHQGNVFFCTVQRRSEGDLVDKPGMGRPYTERQIVIIPQIQLFQAADANNRLYTSLLTALTHKLNNIRVHPLPQKDPLTQAMEVEAISSEESFLLAGDHLIDRMAESYGYLLWKSRKVPDRENIWNLYFHLCDSVTRFKNVLVVKDTSIEANNVSIEDYIVVLEILQTTLHIVDPKKLPLSFALDYFSHDVFDILFAHPSDAIRQFQYAKVVKLSEVMAPNTKISFEQPVRLATSDDQVYYSVPLNDYFKMLYVVFFLAPFDSFDMAVRRWLELVPHIRDGHWGDFYLDLLRGTMTAQCLMTIVNTAMNANREAIAQNRPETITEGRLIEVLSHPDLYATDEKDVYRLLSLALNYDKPLASYTIRYYADHLATSQADLVNFASRSRDKRWVETLLRKLEGKKYP